MLTGAQFTPFSDPKFLPLSWEAGASVLSTNEQCVCFRRKHMTKVTCMYKQVPPKDLKWKKKNCLRILTSVLDELRAPVGSARV